MCGGSSLCHWQPPLPDCPTMVDSLGFRAPEDTVWIWLPPCLLVPFLSFRRLWGGVWRYLFRSRTVAAIQRRLLLFGAHPFRRSVGTVQAAWLPQFVAQLYSIHQTGAVEGNLEKSRASMILALV